MRKMEVTRREAAVALAGLGAAAAAWLPRSAAAQTGHEDHGQMGHEGRDMVPAQPEGPSGSAQAGDGSDWMRIVRGTQHPARTIEPGEEVAPGEPARDYTPLITPNGATLPYKIVDGVKVFHLVAEELMHEFAPGLKAKLWGFNGQVHGPTIEAVEGDRVRIYVTNRLPASTSIHWHGIILPSGMDGVGGLSQRVIQPGETFKYEYPLVQYGTHMYHSHHDEMVQMGLGLMGLFVIHPRRPSEPRPDRDFALLLSEWDIKPGAYRPDPRVFAGFNTLTFNARVFPGTEPLVAKRGERVRLRLVNLSAMDHHPIHLHGHSFWVTQTDGGVIPPSARWPESTVIVPVGQTRTVDFIADNPGDWALHCHMTHHVMNQMGHEGPNMVGVDAKRLNRQIQPVIPAYMTMGEAGMGDMGQMATHMPVPENSIPMLGAQGPHDYIDMGGMFTILKVRENLTSYADPGWYQAPPGTIAEAATREELNRDEIEEHVPTVNPGSGNVPSVDHGGNTGHRH